MISLVVTAKARYSASATEREMVVYFFAFQEIKESPRNMQKPMINFLESGHPAQSTSEKPFSWGDDEEEKKRP